jgi:Rrf2 family protein
MKISRKTDYALRVMLELATSRKKLRIREISRKKKIPFKFLQQVVLQLRSLGYIRTYRGKGGGIALLKNPADVTLKELILSFEGSLFPVPCSESGGCPEMHSCVLYPIWEELRYKIEDVLEKITLQHVVDRFLRSRVYYNI